MGDIYVSLYGLVAVLAILVVVALGVKSSLRRKQKRLELENRPSVMEVSLTLSSSDQVEENAERSIGHK